MANDWEIYANKDFPPKCGITSRRSASLASSFPSNTALRVFGLRP
jgi:hypothetical protein